MMLGGETVRIIRVFVSSPSDVAEERKVLDEVIARINRTYGQARQALLEAWKWETDVVPQIGPKAQAVVDKQMPTHYDVYLGIMKHRFGTPTDGYGSGTEKEFNDAFERWGKVGSTWILFYFDKTKLDHFQLNDEQFEQFTKVRQFRKKLEGMGLHAAYEGVRGSDEGFFEKVDLHLRNLLQLFVPLRVEDAEKTVASPTAYLRDLLARTEYIDIRGLQVGREHAHRFPIEELYISLTTTQTPAPDGEKRKRRRGKGLDEHLEVAHVLRENRALPLHLALRHDRLVVVGDPGAGKTTFLRRVAHALCQTELGDVPDAALERVGISERTFPILVPLSSFDDHIRRHRNDPAAPAEDDAPAWLPHYLAKTSQDKGWGLDGDFFRERLEGGHGTALLDGLDEAADRVARKRLSRLIENIGGTYGRCRMVVTSRPAAYTGEAVLPDLRDVRSRSSAGGTSGFAHARIDPLSDEAVATFLSRWCEALYQENAEAARDHCTELLTALRARPDIRRMARNPVMLTALAVVHWNERRLPEQRADLYDSIIRWLSRAREQKPERVKAEHTVVLLQEVALAMQDHPDGMRTEVDKRWAAMAFAGEWKSGVVDKDSLAAAEEFLTAEEVDSGIIVGRAENVRFWHRSFQEFLAARALAARPDAEQQKRLWSPSGKIALPRLYLPEWREVVLLLAGLLHQRGRATVHDLVKSMLGRAGGKATLIEQARCAGLIGAMLRDLAPVGYQVLDHQYETLRWRVMAIFEREGSLSVPIETRIEAADALGQAGDPRLDAGRKDYWATIPAGEFWMGAQKKKRDKPDYDSEAYENEAPVHRVYLDAFQIARYPVTVEQYRQFVEHEGYQEERWWEAGGFGEFTEPDDWDSHVQYPSRPVVGVSWYEAAAYCKWAKFRLPTEAEWERAARGPEGRRYPWGYEAAELSRLNYGESKIGHPTPVGIYPLGTTPEGICDLAGNVWEWCADWFGEYPDELVRNPSGPPKALARVIRGSSWDGDSRYCRASFRLGYGPVFRYGTLGFRVAPVPSGGQAG